MNKKINLFILIYNKKRVSFGKERISKQLLKTREMCMEMRQNENIFMRWRLWTTNS